MQPVDDTDMRILITRTDRIGDLILSTPVFSEIKKKFPRAWLACLTFLENREIVEGNPYLDEIILYDKKGSEKGWLGQLIFAGKIRAKRFHKVIHLHSTNRMHWIGFLAGIPERIGWERKSPWALTRALPDIKREGEKHEAAYNFELLRPLGVDCPEELKTYFPISQKAERSLDSLLCHLNWNPGKPYIVINPSASCPSKRWPPHRFGEVIREMFALYKMSSIIIGAESDRSISEKVLQSCEGVPVLDLTGRLSLGMLGALIRRAALLISNDSGPVHIAGAVETPVVSIFGRKQPGLSPQRWGPLGEKACVVWKDVGCEVCLAHNCPIYFLCLDAILPADVVKCAARFQSRFTEAPAGIRR